VVYRIAAEASTTIITENKSPRVRPTKILNTIAPKAIGKAIFNILPKKEKPFLVVKTTKVKPKKSSKVNMAAFWIISGLLKALAIYKSGKKITASATIYTPKPKYCLPGDPGECAHLSAK
jgi:translation elongation factor EF-G